MGSCVIVVKKQVQCNKGAMGVVLGGVYSYRGWCLWSGSRESDHRPRLHSLDEQDKKVRDGSYSSHSYISDQQRAAYPHNQGRKPLGKDWVSQPSEPPMHEGDA